MNCHTTVILVLLAILSLSECKFLSSTMISDGANAPNSPNQIFYYGDNLIVAYGILNGGSLSFLASLAQYNSALELVQNITFPMPCTQMYCNIQIDYLDVEGSNAYLTVSALGSDNYTIYQVDLDSFTIVTEKEYNYIFTKPPSAWLPYNSDHAFWAGKNNLGVVELTPFEFATLSPNNDVTHYIPLNYAYIGGATTALVANNTLVLCGSKDNDRSFLDLINLQSEEVSSALIEGGCGYQVFLSNSSTLAITNSVDENIGVTLIDLSTSLPSVIKKGSVMYEGGYPTNILADSSSIFITTRLWSDLQRNSTIVQVGVGEDESLSIFDVMDVIQPYIAADYLVDILSYALNPNSMQFAIIITKDSNDAIDYILVVQYDQSPNYNYH